MPDYKRISNKLIVALCEIITSAEAAVEEAKKSILADEDNPQNPLQEKE